MENLESKIVAFEKRVEERHAKLKEEMKEDVKKVDESIGYTSEEVKQLMIRLLL